MRLMNLASILGLLLVLGIAFSFEITHSAPSPTLPTGKIMGVILDANNARVVDATIKIEGGKIKRIVHSSDQGKFEISLPTGGYELTVEASGFRRFIFSPLEVKPNQSEMINIHLEIAPPPGLTPAFSRGV